MTTKNKSVSIHPSTFVDPSIADLTAGDVVRLYLPQESKRKRNAENYGESDVAISFRSVPEGLLEALEDVHSSSSFHKSIITKCLSHHIMAWYQSMPQVTLLSYLYKTVQLRSDGFPDVVRRMKRDDYEFVHPITYEHNTGTVRTVAFVLGYLEDVSAVLGVPVFKLFLSGLCWSISTNVEGWSKDNISKFLLPEARNIQVYLDERLLALDYANKLVKLRRGDIDVVEYVKNLGGQKWE